MNATTLRNRLLAAAASTALTLGIAHTASAVPVSGLFLEDPRCDVLPNIGLTHELGEAQFFPINEAFVANVVPATFTVCVPDDLVQNDWVVEIRNVSGIAWQDLHFVADLGITVGNADGNIIDTVNAPGVVCDAFRIDGTVTAGINNNLLSESMGVNEIFEPGELWRFAVSNFADPFGLAPMPAFQTPGLFAGSSPYNPAGHDTASILANPVPEPTTFGALAIVGVAALMNYRPRRR